MPRYVAIYMYYIYTKLNVINVYCHTFLPELTLLRLASTSSSAMVFIYFNRSPFDECTKKNLANGTAQGKLPNNCIKNTMLMFYLSL